MKTKMHWVLALPLLMWGCTKEDLNKILDLGDFTVQVPSDWESVAKQGFDSKTGSIQNKRNELTYDYGWYSYNFNKETAATHHRTTTTIDGRPALIVRPQKSGQGVLGVFIQVDDQTKLTLYGQDIKNEAVVLRIFESVRFSQ